MRTLPSRQTNAPRLASLVDQLIRSSQPVIDRSHSCVINDIPPHLALDHDPEVLSALIGGMLNIAITQAKDSCIRLSAGVAESTVILQLRDYNRFNHYSSPQRFSQIKSLASRLGGSLAIAGLRQGEKTIALHLPIPNRAA